MCFLGWNACVFLVGIHGQAPKKLLCTWHVDRPWKKALKEKIKDQEMQCDVYKMLRTVLEEPTEGGMDHHFQFLLKKLEKTNQSAEFLTHFQSEWVQKTNEWAYCYEWVLVLIETCLCNPSTKCSSTST
jgi:hypothetical protein